jgi:hypothetical protein
MCRALPGIRALETNPAQKLATIHDNMLYAVLAETQIDRGLARIVTDLRTDTDRSGGAETFFSILPSVICL